jgi:hypothetical protein
MVNLSFATMPLATRRQLIPHTYNVTLDQWYLGQSEIRYHTEGPEGLQRCHSCSLVLRDRGQLKRTEGLPVTMNITEDVGDGTENDIEDDKQLSDPSIVDAFEATKPKLESTSKMEQYRKLKL